MPLLDIRNLTVSFATAKGPLKAVDGCDYQVDPGDVLAIVGESGSGKSVAMLAVMGLLPWTATVTADRMMFAGHDLAQLKPAERRKLVGKDLAMIFQEPVASLNPCFTVGFQIEESLRTHLGMNKAAARDRAIALLEAVGIPEPERRLRQFPHQLSGGTCQRVMIAIAIACEPKLLIADEPTTALDVTIQAQILDLLLDLRRRTGSALILITHDMAVVAETAERVIVQYAGQQVERQPVMGLFDQPQHPYTSALLAALPERSASLPGHRAPLPSIPGIVPNLAAPPSGCLFHPRCAKVEPICATTRPTRAITEQGQALCHFPAGNTTVLQLSGAV
jgi:dipeptide transport system ATP-binding protein